MFFSSPSAEIRANMEFNEKLSEVVRKFPVLYDKACTDFKDKYKKRTAWNDVAKELGLSNGDEAKSYFTNLRNRFVRDRKKLKQASVSGSGSDGVRSAKEDTGDMFKYLSWLDTFYKPRKTSTNVVVELDHESDKGDLDQLEDDQTDDTFQDSKSDATDTSFSDSFISNSKIVRVPPKKMRRNSAQDVTAAEIEVLKCIGSTLVEKQSTKVNQENYKKDEDDLFGELIVSQLRQIPQQRKVMIKMQISNILYKEILSSFSKATPSPYVGDSSWGYEHHPQQQCTSQELNWSQGRLPVAGSKAFHVPSAMDTTDEVLTYKPGQLFHHLTSSASQSSNIGHFVDDHENC